MHKVWPSQMPISEQHQKGLLSTLSRPVYNNFNIHVPMCRTDISLLQYMSPVTAIQIIILLQTPVMA